jgi:hypothetical protein
MSFLMICNCKLAFCLIAAISTISAFAQNPSAEAVVETVDAAPVAYVYVSTANGINLYDASSTGKLTLVAGSPFKTTGLMIGSNGKYFITLGTDYVHSYLLASNGAIKQQESEINTQLYTGADCGRTYGAVLDHTGQDVYVQLAGAIADSGEICDALQTFKITSASGEFTFTGAAEFDSNRFAQPAMPLAIASDDLFALNLTDIGDSCELSFNAFHRESNGTLQDADLAELDPVPNPAKGGIFSPLAQAAGAADHLAVAMDQGYTSPCGPHGPIQLASYTVNGEGRLASTNTWENMPKPSIGVSSMNLSPSGKFLAIAGAGGNPAGTGLEVFHFNGASPITPFSGKLTSAPIDQIHWDNANHLYALSDNAGKLYMFTVTSTSITEVPGSPYTIANANGLFVVPK